MDEEQPSFPLSVVSEASGVHKTHTHTRTHAQAGTRKAKQETLVVVSAGSLAALLFPMLSTRVYLMSFLSGWLPFLSSPQLSCDVERVEGLNGTDGRTDTHTNDPMPFQFSQLERSMASSSRKGKSKPFRRQIHQFIAQVIIINVRDDRRGFNLDLGGCELCE